MSGRAHALGRTLIGSALGLVAFVWLRTLRLTVVVDPALRAAGEDRPWVLAFLHGKQWPLLAWRRRRPTAALVSLSADGALAAAAFTRLGLHVVRGSSSRGGASGLTALVRLLRRGAHDVALAVDGPRGPRGEVKPGALTAARLARNALVVPMGSAAASGHVLRSWDRFELAWPFARVAVVLGAPLELADPPGAEPDAVARLSAGIARANEDAAGLLRPLT